MPVQLIIAFLLTLVALWFVTSAMGRLFRGAPWRGPGGQEPDLPPGLEPVDKKTARSTAIRAALGIFATVVLFAHMIAVLVALPDWPWTRRWPFKTQTPSSRPAPAGPAKAPPASSPTQPNR